MSDPQNPDPLGDLTQHRTKLCFYCYYEHQNKNINALKNKPNNVQPIDAKPINVK